ncbi:MAG TPA: dTDP-glucose 4,6-dehydratase [Kofleriaceae bacterium]|nr:dTDP-glucose 4,6-dehydratase [Kofleriaceae bacterium]
MRSVVVTGGAGFIGCHFVRDLLAAERDVEITVLDKLTYAGNRYAIAELAADPRFAFAHGDIADRALVREVLAHAQPDVIVHFAAESHVDRSIDAPATFIETNIVGTFALLEECRRHLATSVRRELRFVHVSTDEVFGTLGATGAFDETSRYAPRSPYAASKAAADHLVDAYVHTYGLPAIVTNCSNNYGPGQYPEKLIPRVIASALAGKVLPVYGRGDNVRDWIHVSDHCAALRAVIARGELGAHYVIGARAERTNLEIVHRICELLDDRWPRARGGSYRDQIAFVADRPGHDFRYAIDPSKLERELGWRPAIALDDGLRATVAWYADRLVEQPVRAAVS